MALSRAHTSAKAADDAKLLLLSKDLSCHAGHRLGPTYCNHNPNVT